ncbi:MAG TPA: SpoIIE family protein phosphatase [Roseiflexaceae bacterium]|nr:SpoIIE family protein phosphatase [Roseiflexaceae bacterium]
MTLTELEQIPFLATLPPEEIAALTAYLRPRDYPAGMTLFREGEIGDRLFILLSGEIAIFKELDAGEERLFGIRGAGEFIGEMSFLSADGRRSAGARVVADARMLELTRADFDAFVRRLPSLAYEMLRVISARLRESNDAAVRDLREKNRQLTQAYAELQAAQARLVEQERMAHEMQLAREIQENMHPPTLDALPGYEVGARIVPAREVAGDFFDVFRLDDDTLAVAVGDVCGKGVPAALYMAQTRSLIRAEAARASSPEETLRAVNRHLLDLNARGGMFVTLIYGVLRGSAGEFTVARAGHELPLVWDASGTPIPQRLQVGHPLGLLPSPAIDTQRIALPPGATLLLYTDGASETADLAGAFFGREQLLAVARQASPQPQALCDALVQALAAYRGPAPQADDITLLALRAL